MRGLYLALAVLWSAAAPAAADELVELALPATLPWTGLGGASAEGSAGAMLYPAPTPLIGLLAVLTHGALVSGSRAAEDQRRQREADKVLEPCLPALAAWTPRALIDAATRGSEGRLAAAGEGVQQARWRVELEPTFVMYPDRSRLMLDGKLRIVDLAVPGTTPFEAEVRVLSNRRDDETGFPSDDDAAQLKHESARLFAHAVDVALYVHRRQRDGAGDDAPFKTHRYLNGTRDGVERAQWLGQGCSRSLLRTLRGVLLSVPLRTAGDAPPACSGQPYRFPLPLAAEAASTGGSAAAR